MLAAIDAAFVDAGGRPLQNVRVRHTIVLDDPFDDPPQLAEHVPDASPVPVYEQARPAVISGNGVMSLGPELCMRAPAWAGGRSLAAMGAAQPVLQRKSHCRLAGLWSMATSSRPPPDLPGKKM